MDTMDPIIQISPGASKWDIRQQVWDYFEEKDLANFPRPVYNRAPNFKGAFSACAKVFELQVFSKAAVVKVDPDKPLEGARLVVLQARKTLLVPTPRLRSGLFNEIIPPKDSTREQLRLCSSSQGVKYFSMPVGLDAKIKIDLVVVGSVAVSKRGLRIGEGEGFTDMEYGMMVSMGAVDKSTVVVTIVHDCQVVDIPEELQESHDLTVDYILTPTRFIKTNCPIPKPHGIIWTKVYTEMMEKIPILRSLRDLEEQAGKDVSLRLVKVLTPDVVEPGQQAGQPRHTLSERSESEPEHEATQHPATVKKESRGDDEEGESSEMEKGKHGGNVKAEGPEEGGGEVPSHHSTPLPVTTVYLGGIPDWLHVSELKAALRERNACPLRLTWQGDHNRAFLDYGSTQAADQALKALRGFSVNGYKLHAKLAKSQRGSIPSI